MRNVSRLSLPARLLWLFLVVLPAFPPRPAQAGGENRLVRVGTQPRPGYTRVTLYFLRRPSYRLSRLPGAVRLTFRATDSPPFKRLRALNDRYVAGVHCSQRGPDLQVTVPLRDGASALPLDCGALSLCLDVGVRPVVAAAPEILPGREAILSGTQSFVRDFAPPTRAALPFAPTDPKLLHQLFSPGEVAQFEAAETLLYREKGAEALEALTPFLAKSGAARGLASYRAGEALYLMERYDAALKSFRDGELLWPEFLAHAPALTEEYADTLARGGDYLAGRRLMGRLIAAYSGESYQPALINRLAQMTARHGDAEIALHLYRTVAERFPGSVAAARARMKLADQEMFVTGRDGVGSLIARYRAIATDAGEVPLRDEALFKVALLQALYAPYQEALDQAATYERLYPRGIFVAIVRKLREELVFVAYRDLYQDRAREALVKLALDNRDYLARSFEDPQFAPRLAETFHGVNQVAREVELFRVLADRSFAAQAAPLIMQHLVQDGVNLGMQQLAEETAKAFVARFPRHVDTPRMQELLARMAFDRGDFKETALRLRFLAAGGAPRPVYAESDYYLGKALLSAGDNRGAERSLARFVAAAPASPLACDARFGRVQALCALGDRRAAVEACRQGAQSATGENADRFLYRMGELQLQLKQMREAAASWDKVVKGGREGVWRTMAQEALNDLSWRLKMAGELPSPSKK